MISSMGLFLHHRQYPRTYTDMFRSSIHSYFFSSNMTNDVNSLHLWRLGVQASSQPPTPVLTSSSSNLSSSPASIPQICPDLEAEASEASEWDESDGMNEFNLAHCSHHQVRNPTPFSVKVFMQGFCAG
jgi:hypothetical protein